MRRVDGEQLDDAADETGFLVQLAERCLLRDARRSRCRRRAASTRPVRAVMSLKPADQQAVGLVDADVVRRDALNFSLTAP